MSQEFSFAHPLTPENIKKYVNNGDKINKDQMEEFIAICQKRKVDPFLKEIYIQGYVNRKTGKGNFNFYIGKDGTLLRARRIEDYAGHEIGWFLEDGSRVEDPVEVGGKKIVGAYCKVYIKGFSVPVNASALLSEYAPTDLKATWASHTTQMIAKCAIVAAHRNAYPEAFGGLYAKEELDKVRGEGDGEGTVGVAATAAKRSAISDERKQEFIDRLLQTEAPDALDLIMTEFMSVSQDVDYIKQHLGKGIKITWEEGVNVPNEAMFHVLKAYRAQYQKFVMSRLFLLELNHTMQNGKPYDVCALFLDDEEKRVDNPMISMHRAMVLPKLIEYCNNNKVEAGILEKIKEAHFSAEVKDAADKAVIAEMEASSDTEESTVVN